MRSQLDHVESAVDKVPVEPSNRTILLPALTPASTGSRQSLNCGRENPLQGISSFSNDVDTSRALPEDSIWNLDLDHSTNHISTPTLQTDISNVSNPNPISLTPFATDTEWQFTVDDQFFAEPISASTETCSTAFTELDLSQFYNQQTEGFDPTGDSGELFEFLSLRDKVSTELHSMLSIVASARLTQNRVIRGIAFWVNQVFQNQKGSILICHMSRACT